VYRVSKLQRCSKPFATGGMRHWLYDNSACDDDSLKIHTESPQ
jgi:hypothetical protein